MGKRSKESPLPLLRVTEPAHLTTTPYSFHRPKRMTWTDTGHNSGGTKRTRNVYSYAAKPVIKGPYRFSSRGVFIRLHPSFDDQYSLLGLCVFSIIGQMAPRSIGQTILKLHLLPFVYLVLSLFSITQVY